jgi:hypothetical protein
MTEELLCCTKMRFDHKGFYDEESGYQLVIENEDEYLTMSINYCPWCGKEVPGK